MKEQTVDSSSEADRMIGEEVRATQGGYPDGRLELFLLRRRLLCRLSARVARVGDEARHVSDVDVHAADADKHLRRAVVAIDDLIGHEMGHPSSPQVSAIVRRISKAVTNARRHISALRAGERASVEARGVHGADV